MDQHGPAWTSMARGFEERCRHDPDMVLAAVTGDGRCLSLSSLQHDEDFVREAVRF